MKRQVFAIKVHVEVPGAREYVFRDQKTMYGGRLVAEGHTIYIFSSETYGGQGLLARGVVTSARESPRIPGVERQTPRVSITVRRTVMVTRPLEKSRIQRFCDWDDGRPETELNFKFYRQSTNKIVGISGGLGAFLRRHF